MEKIIEIAVGLADRAGGRGGAANPEKKMKGMMLCVVGMGQRVQDHVNTVFPS